jgi:hypothetical protein
MSESFAEQLSQFTPDGAGLDRDALLFAAGRASARPNRGWMALAGTLAACQVLTCVLFWPKAPATISFVRDDPSNGSMPEQIQPSTPSEATEVRDLNGLAFVWKDGTLPTPAPVESMAPQSPPLHAFDRSFLSD